MHPVAIIRNVLIFAGIAGGAALAILAAVSGPDPAEEQQQQVADSPIVLNTAKPPELGKTPLNKPISLESGFGRSELTGEEVLRVPENPLDELIFDRRWDISISLTPPAPPTDLPPAKASDEVGEPAAEDASLKDDYHLADLPNEARTYADEAVTALKKGTNLLKEGMKESRMPGQAGREGRKKVADAADFLRDARDKLTKALQLSPNHAELLHLMQETKANLYICLKHGR